MTNKKLDREHAEFKWIEFSVTVHRQTPPFMIKLQDLEKTRKKYGDEDLYTSVYRYLTDDPYLGPVLSGFYMDFDCAENPERARKEAYVTVHTLITQYKIPVDSISISFSGRKGIAIFVNRRVFGTEPSENLPLVWKSMARELAATLNLKTVDFRPYHCRALWRLLNSRHPKSGLYKVPVTYVELETLKIQKIRELALKPRPIVYKLEHPLVPEAQAWYKKHVKLVNEQLSQRHGKIETADLKGLPTVPCVMKRLEQGSPEGLRNISVFQLSVYFARAGKSIDETKKIMLDFNRRCTPPLSESEVLRTVESAFEGVKANKYYVGCSSESLYDLCDKANCPFFGAERRTEILKPPSIEALQTPTVFSDEVKAEAMKHLHENPIEYVVKVGNILHKGDEVLLELDWLSTLTPELNQQLHLMSVGKTGKGKTHHAEVALEFVPKEYVIYVNEPSPKSFFYASKAGVKFDKCILLIDDARDEHIPILKALTSQNRRKPRAWSVDDQEFIDMQIEGNIVVWCSSVRPLRDEQGQLVRRFYIVNPTEDPALDEEVKQFIIERRRRGLGIGELPKEFEVVKCMTQILKQEQCRVITPFDFDFPADPERTLPGFFMTILEASAKANMFNRIVTEKDGEKTIWATPEDFERAKRIWKQFLLFQKKVDYLGLRVLDILPDKEPEADITETKTGKIIEVRPEPGPDAPTVSWIAKKLREKPREINRILTDLYEAGLVNKKWWGAWNTAHYYWKPRYLTQADTEIKIKPESLTLEALKTFCACNGIEKTHAKKYFQKFCDYTVFPPAQAQQKAPTKTKETTTIKETMYKCSQCKCIFSSKHDLNLHIQSMHERNEKITEREVKVNKTVGVSCHVCRKFIEKGWVKAKDGNCYCLRCFKAVFGKGKGANYCGKSKKRNQPH